MDALTRLCNALTVRGVRVSPHILRAAVDDARVSVTWRINENQPLFSGDSRDAGNIYTSNDHIKAHRRLSEEQA